MEKKWKLFITPHFHFDVAWIKTYEEYLDLAFNNILDVMHLIEKNPEYRFCLDQVALIEPFLKRNCELIKTFRKMVKNGKIEIVCGMYTMPDVNIPSGEFLIRQFYFGKRFFKNEFGVDVKCGWIIDSFGHPNQLPQILKKAGIKYYVFGRGAPKDLNKTEFLWEGLDGTRILTHWMIGTYIVGWIPSPTGNILRKIAMELPFITRAILHAQSTRWLPVPIEKGVEKILAVFLFLKMFASTNNILIPNGADFTPPQRELIEVVEKISRENKNLEVVISTPSEFFESIEKMNKELPIVQGEFNPVFQGVYSSRISLKIKNRIAENLLLTAEKFAALSSLLGFHYPEHELEEITKYILFNHFHDIICGCCTDEVYVNAMNRFNKAIEKSKQVLTASLEFIAENINTKGEGIPIIVFNQLAWDRTDIVEVEVQFTSPSVREVSVVNHQGQPVPFQILHEERYTDGEIKTLKIAFLAENIPSMGYTTYFILPRKVKPIKTESKIKVGENFIENENLRVVIDADHGGAITSIYDKRNRREILDTRRFYGNTLIIEKDFGDLYEFNGDSNGMATRNTLKIERLPESWQADFSSNYKARVWREVGPLMAKLVIEGNMEETAYRKIVTLYKGANRVDFKLFLKFDGKNRRIRLCMPFNIKNGEIIHETPYGITKRGEGEYPAQSWVDYSNQEYGVSLINKGIPGNSIVEGVALLTLLRSVNRVLQFHPAGEKALEKGEHEYEYSLYPHKGNWREGKTYKVAMEFSNPLIAIKTVPHSGKLPKKFSFMSISPENVIVTSLKKNGKYLILRFYEASGKNTNAKILFHKPPKEVWITDLLEEKIKKIQHKGEKISINVKKFEIVTLALKF